MDGAALNFIWGLRNFTGAVIPSLSVYFVEICHWNPKIQPATHPTAVIMHVSDKPCSDSVFSVTLGLGFDL